MGLKVKLQTQGPFTGELWELVKDAHRTDGRVFHGKGRSRFDAVLQAVNNMRASVSAENRRESAKWAQEAWDQLKSQTNAPGRIEGNLIGLAEYATIWIGPLGPNQDL